MALAIGFGALVGLPVLAVLLMITVLGIPLGVAAFALYALLLLAGYLSGALFVADRARLAMQREAAAGYGATVGYLALALAILMLLGIVPFVGPLSVFLTTIAGIGACVIEVHRRRQASTAPAA
jgi:putative flippase GtrA